MLLWFHILFVIILLILLFCDMRKTNGSKLCMALIRILYLGFIIDGLFLLPMAWSRNPILACIKVIVSVCMIGFLEFLMVQRMKNKLDGKLLTLSVVLLLCLIILGLFTAGFRPWIHL